MKDILTDSVIKAEFFGRVAAERAVMLCSVTGFFINLFCCLAAIGHAVFH